MKQNTLLENSKNKQLKGETSSIYTTDFAVLLQEEFSKRSRKNSRFSLRAFARLLEIDPSTLSQYMSNKRKASLKVINKFCHILAVHPAQKEKLTGSRNNKSESYVEISFDVFNVISDWYHIAILEFVQIHNQEASSKNIARHLGISITDCQIAINRLLRLELLEEKNGRLLKTNLNLTNFKSGETSSAHKHLQKQVITKALEAVEGVQQEEKDITSIFMSIDESKLPEARIRIEKFRKEMCNFMEEGEKTRVYNLAIQLFPISQKLNTKGDI